MENQQGPFEDRRDGGRKLAARLRRYARRDDVVVLGLPRGGVPVAFEVARSLQVPLDVFGVRKLGVPGHEELAMGAVASGGVRVLNEDVVIATGGDTDQIDAATQRERDRIGRQEQTYRGERPPRGDNEPPEPTFGAFGIAERLNWLAWKRCRNTPSQCLISAIEY